MTFIAYLNQKGMIENVGYLIMPKQVSEQLLLFLTGLFSFIFSSLADNITATLVSYSLILSLDPELKKRFQSVTPVVLRSTQALPRDLLLLTILSAMADNALLGARFSQRHPCDE